MRIPSALPVRGGRVRRDATATGTGRSGRSFGRVPAQHRTGARCGGVSAFGRPLLEVKGLRMHFPITEGIVARKLVGEVKAIDGIDFTVHRGETLGLVGESG